VLKEILFFKNAIYVGIENAEFDVNFESREKGAKRLA
jgi:hypothetical protein